MQCDLGVRQFVALFRFRPIWLVWSATLQCFTCSFNQDSSSVDGKSCNYQRASQPQRVVHCTAIISFALFGSHILDDIRIIAAAGWGAWIPSTLRRLVADVEPRNNVVLYTTLTMSNHEVLTDDYVAGLLSQEANDCSLKFSAMGMDAFKPDKK